MAFVQAVVRLCVLAVVGIELGLIRGVGCVEEQQDLWRLPLIVFSNFEHELEYNASAPLNDLFQRIMELPGRHIFIVQEGIDLDSSSGSKILTEETRNLLAGVNSPWVDTFVSVKASLLGIHFSDFVASAKLPIVAKDTIVYSSPKILSNRAHVPFILDDHTVPIPSGNEDQIIFPGYANSERLNHAFQYIVRRLMEPTQCTMIFVGYTPAHREDIQQAVKQARGTTTRQTIEVRTRADEKGYTIPVETVEEIPVWAHRSITPQILVSTIILLVIVGFVLWGGIITCKLQEPVHVPDPETDSNELGLGNGANNARSPSGGEYGGN